VIARAAASSVLMKRCQCPWPGACPGRYCFAWAFRWLSHLLWRLLGTVSGPNLIIWLVQILLIFTLQWGLMGLTEWDFANFAFL